MRCDAYYQLASARIRGRPLHRHAVVELERSTAFALSSALAMPRLWSYATSHALYGFQYGFGVSEASRGPARLEAAIFRTRGYLAAACDALIERSTPDATLTALIVENDELHTLTCGAGRVYLHRRGGPKRLTPREEESGGILASKPVKCSVSVQPGDVIIAGSVTAFSNDAISRIAHVLEKDRTAPLAVLTSIMTEPAESAGAGAAAVAIRVR